MSSSEPVAKKSSWKTWVGVVSTTAGVIGVGLAFRGYRIRKLESFDYAVKVGMTSLQEGCSFTTQSATLVSSAIGYVERPPQVYDELFDLSTKSYSSKPYVIWAPSGTGKSEYNMKKLEERGSHFMHLMCKGEGLSEDLVGETLGVHPVQHDNSFKILGEALSKLSDDQESPRCLLVVEDPTIDNALVMEKLHEWNKGGLCDLMVVLSERKNVDEILDAMSGKQSRPRLVEYLPPTKDSFDDSLKKPLEGGFSFDLGDLMELLDFLGINFADYDEGLEYLDSGLSIEATMLKLTEKFKGEVESSVTKGSIQKYIKKEDLIEVLLDLYNNGVVTDEDHLRAIAHLVDENILRTLNSHYIYHKKGMEIGVSAYLDSNKTEKE